MKKRNNPEKIEPSWIGLSKLIGKNVFVKIENSNDGLFYINSTLNFINIPRPKFEIYYPDRKKIILYKSYCSFLPNLVKTVTETPSGQLISLYSSDINTEILREFYNWKNLPIPENPHIIINDDFFHKKGSYSTTIDGSLRYNKDEKFFYLKLKNSVFCTFKRENIYKIHYNMVYINI